MADIKPLTREDISLHTGTDAEYYDEVCALSVSTINKNFELLWAMRDGDDDDIKTLIFDNGESNIGRLEATMKPPRILVDPNQEVKLPA